MARQEPFNKVVVDAELETMTMDAREGITAFLEKRRSNFFGR